MNEQQPNYDSAPPPADSFATGSYAEYSQSGFQDSPPVTHYAAELNAPQAADSATPEVQRLAQLEVAPVAQPLASSPLLTGLGSFATRDSWEENDATSLSQAVTETTAPMLSSSLPGLATPEAFEPAQHLSAPFSVPTLPNTTFPTPLALPDHYLGVADIQTGIESGVSLPPVGQGFTVDPGFGTPPSLSVPPTLPTAFPSIPTFPSAPGFAPTPAFPAAQTGFEPPAFPGAQNGFEPLSFPAAPAFPVAPSLPSAPTFPTSPFPTAPLAPLAPLAVDGSFATPEQSFDAGDSYAPLDLARPDTTLPASTDPFEGQVDFSSNPLPRPEALVIREAPEAPKPSRFGRKKKAPVDLLSVDLVPALPTPSIPSSPSASAPVVSKNKRFGKKSAQTVDLLGAPIAARTAETVETARLNAASPQPSSLVEPASEDKGKRKLFARVDRTNEKPLTPTNGKARKMIQGLAALSLLAGAGLFTLSFLDKKSPTPVPVNPATETTVPTVAAGDPTPSTLAPAAIDPATGLPVEATAGLPTVPPNPDASSPTSTADGTTVVDAPVASVPNSPDGSGATDGGDTSSDSIPASGDPQPSVTTIAPGPDDLEFSTGGNFSEG
jgi:hypothetical protein